MWHKIKAPWERFFFPSLSGEKGKENKLMRTCHVILILSFSELWGQMNCYKFWIKIELLPLPEWPFVTHLIFLLFLRKSSKVSISNCLDLCLAMSYFYKVIRSFYKTMEFRELKSDMNSKLMWRTSVKKWSNWVRCFVQ